MKCLGSVIKILRTIEKYKLDREKNPLINEFEQVHKLINDTTENHIIIEVNSQNDEEHKEKVKHSMRDE